MRILLFVKRNPSLLPALFIALLAPVCLAQKTLPALHDGLVIDGGGPFRHDGPLAVQGHVVLRHLALDLRGPIEVASGAFFELDDVQLTISDPPGAPNGVSGLRSSAPAHITVRHSTMRPAGTAHPMWNLHGGQIEIDGFKTFNSELHLANSKATLNNLEIFELEISEHSTVQARGLNLVFLSTHSSNDDRLTFSDIPVRQKFTRTLNMGSGAKAELRDTQLQIFLLYLHGGAHADLSRIDRAQLAFFPDCKGTLHLPRGRVGTASNPVLVPEPKASDCAFQFTLRDVNADTWDVYAGGHADLTLENSLVDELTADGDASLHVRNSDLYADWLSIGGSARIDVDRSTAGALRLASQRPDLATSEIRISDNAAARFSGVTFDCGVVATGQAKVQIVNPVQPPKYERKSGTAQILTEASAH